MSFPRWIISFLLCLTVVGVLPTTAGAQDTMTPELDGVFHLPAVFVQNTHLQLVTADKIEGTFELANQDTTTLGGITYRIYLIDPAPESAPNTIAPESFFVYDQVVSSETFSLTAGETKQLTFSYVPPTVPTGTYRLRLRVSTANGQELGWEDTLVQIGSATGFLTVSQGYVYAQGGSLIDGELAADGGADPLAGVNVPPGANIKFTYRLKNIGSAPVTATPTLQVHEWDQAGRVVATQTSAPITLAAGGTSEELFLTAPAVTKPTAYYAVLTMVDSSGKKVSTVAEYRYVTTGLSGRILSATFSEITPDRAVATITVVGPADRSNTLTGTLSAELLHGGQSVSTQVSEPLSLGAENTSTITFAFPSPPAGQLGLRATLRTSDGTTLDTYEYTIDTPVTPPATPPQPTRSRAVIASIAALLVLVIVAVAIKVWASRRTPPFVPPATTSLLLLFALTAAGLGTSGLLAQLVHSQGQSVYYFPPRAITGDYVTVFVNRPVHNGAPINAAAVPFSAEIKWAHCNNRWTVGRLYLDYFTAGGFSVPTAQEWIPEADTPRGWRGQLSLIKNQLPATLLPANRWSVLADSGSTFECRYSCPGGYNSIQSRTFAGTLRFNPNLPNTTVRYLAMKLHRPQPENVYFYKNLYGTYAHLNFITPPTPTPTPTTSPTPTTIIDVTPSPSAPAVAQCSDGLDNDGDNKIDAADPGCHTDNRATNATSYDPNDNDETDPQCSDSIDNDGDNKIDAADPTCHTDHNAANPSSYSPSLPSEADTACSDTQDNDGDSKIDQNDPGCRTIPTDPTTYNPNDNDETDPVLSPGPIIETD